MEKKNKKLKLSKETLVNLQEKQLKSLIGGEALASNGSTSSYTCSSQGTCTPLPISSDSCVACPQKPEVQEFAAVSCCAKTCN